MKARIQKLAHATYHKVALKGFLLLMLLIPGRMMAVGTWAQLVNQAPGGIQIMLLLSDGSVMAANRGGNAWYRLTPDAHGSYVNGTWTTRASMNNTRLFYSSAVLRDGRVLVAGAEYGTGWGTAEVYSPYNDSWVTAPVPAGLLTSNNVPAASGQSTAGFSDSGCKILANGTVMVAPVYPITNNATLIFNPADNTWSGGPTTLSDQNEASWVKLPDDSILAVDKSGTTSERYIPSLNQWIKDKPVPVSLYDSYAETGPALLLQNGKAFFLGGSGQTALYTPSGNTNMGTWVAGPSIPGGLGAPDAPTAVMANGKILCAVGPLLYSTNISGKVSTVFPTPTSFYEYDPIANAFTSVTGPTGLSDSISPFQAMMLALPDGNVLYSDYGIMLYVYRPDGSPIAAGKPKVTGITVNAGGSFHLEGEQLNGISEGAAYGDDAQMDSNYPLVRINDGTNLVYGTTFNWSSTSITSGKASSTEFTVPVNVAPGNHPLVAVANGISSDTVSFYAPLWVDYSYPGPTESGTFINPFNSLSKGRDNVLSGGTIFLKAGHRSEAITINKAMSIAAFGGDVTIGH